eukprot:1145602-Pelagomonas_calceolata.AAC.1
MGSKESEVQGLEVVGCDPNTAMQPYAKQVGQSRETCCACMRVFCVLLCVCARVLSLLKGGGRGEGGCSGDADSCAIG